VSYKSSALAAIVLGFVTGCSSVPVAVCAPIKDYPESFSNQLANEMETMPADSATVQAIGDYIELRDVLRTCQ
jgi:hypothetical protein